MGMGRSIFPSLYLQTDEKKKDSMKRTFETTSVSQRIEHIWLLVRDAKIRRAKAASETLVSYLQRQWEEMPEECDLLQALVHAYHLAGYTAAMRTRRYDALVPASYFREMEHMARLLQDDVQVVIALTYQGEMYRRFGDLTQALQCLHAAYETPLTERAVHGNGARLLGRMYAQQGEHERALQLIEEAKQMARQDDALQDRFHGFFGVGVVYLEYARYFRQLGQFHQALDFCAQAKAAFPGTPHWTTIFTTIQGCMLVEGGHLEEGIPVVVKAVEFAQKHGYICLLDLFSDLQRFLSQQALAFNRASLRLGEALV